MRRNKILNFSNIYSSKSQEPLKNQKFSSSLERTQKISPNTLKETKFRKTPKQSIANIPNIDNYRNQRKLTFTGQRAIQINKRLDIDSIIQKSFQKRVKDGNLLINFTDNPFTKFLLQSPATSDKRQRVSIISELNRLKNMITTDTMIKKFMRQQSPLNDYIRLSKKLHSIKAKRKGNQSESKLTFQKHQVSAAKVRKYNEFQLLDQIVKSKQESFFNQQRRLSNWNIFQLINDKNHEDFLSNKEILAKYHFNRDSIFNIHLTQKKKFQNNCLEEISSFAREIVVNPNIKLKKMPERLMVIPGDLRLDLQRLQFDNIMIVAGGRLPTSVLLKYFREQELVSKNSPLENGEEKPEQKKPTEIIYNNNCVNRGDNFNPGIKDRAQIGVYGNSYMSQIQIDQSILSASYKQKFRKIVNEQAQTMSLFIRDKEITQKMKDQKNKILLEQLDGNADNRISKLMKEVDRKIRMNKIGKNRTEKIKVKLLIETLKIKNSMDRNQVSKNKNKSTLLNSWR